MPGEITCRRCGQRKPAQERAPVPGRWGPVVLEQTCAACWQDWVEEQTRVMNHEGLLPSEPAHRAILYDKMKGFLNLDV